MGRTSYNEQQIAAHKRRTLMSSLMIFIAVPLTLWGGYRLFGGAKYMITSLLVIVYTMVPFFMLYEKRRPKAREIVLIAMMTAITVCAHMIFHVTIPLQIGTAMVIIAGISMGPEAGFLVGALSRFVCNFFQGQGPWTPWQMFCWGLLGFLAGFAFNKVDPQRLKLGKLVETPKSRSFQVVMGPVLCIAAALILAYVTYLLVPGLDQTFFGWRVYVFGALGLIAGVLLQRKRMPVDNITITVFTFFTTLILYGGIMNLSMLFYSTGLPGAGSVSFNTLRALYISGLPYDLTHAAMASLCIFVMGNPMIKKIERIKVKYGIYR